MCGSGCWIGHRRLTTFPSPRSPPDRAPCCQLCVCSQVLPAATEPLRFLLQEESHSLGSPGGPRQDAASLPRILGSEMVSLGSSFPREGGRQDSPPAQEERGAEEAERTVGQGCLSSGPWGCASFPPHQPLNTHPPLAYHPHPHQGQMGAGREKRDHGKSTLKWQQSPGSQLCPLRPGQSLMSGLCQPGWG